MSVNLGGKYLLGNNMTTPQALTALGTGLKKKRLQKNATQEELSKHAGVSVSLVKRLESGGAISTENLIKILMSLEMLKPFLDIMTEDERLITPQQEWEMQQQRLANEPKRIRKKTNV